MTEQDLARCRRGMAQLEIEGRPRHDAIEQAIAAIQRDPKTALVTRYFGVKNYAGFGDQREDHEYGYGRTAAARQPVAVLDADAIYLLEAYRDFGVADIPNYDGKTITVGLCDAIRRYDRLTAERQRLEVIFCAVRAESHVSV